jgi:hypothetical protein
MGSVPQNKLMRLLEHNNKNTVKDDNDARERVKPGYKLCSSVHNIHTVVQYFNSPYQSNLHHSHTTETHLATVTEESYILARYTKSIL